MNGAAGPSYIDSRERVLKLGGSFEKQPRCAFHTVKWGALFNPLSYPESAREPVEAGGWKQQVWVILSEVI
uniref:Uncharacterized protein n=1 Tax=Moschus moschiferus TaxID=68415 RepID=A0A8C6FPK5_MOSMO